MAVKIVPTLLILPWFKVNALAFIPAIEGEQIKSEWALFTHGYTSHKGDCLNWASRLVETGVPCMIFDQPGHYLGSFNEVSSLEDFKAHAHELFAEAFDKLNEILNQELSVNGFPEVKKIILGGHSLGAYTAIRALDLSKFQNLETLAVGIGMGIGQKQATHIFETAFYEKTLAIRRQLVSPKLDAKEVFAWLKTEKENLKISEKRIHLITGEDDVVVGAGGMEAFVAVLEKNNNVVTFERPGRLPHHEPGAATPHLFSFLKKHFGW